MDGISQKTSFVSGCAGRRHRPYSLLHRRIFQRPIIPATERSKPAITIIEDYGFLKPICLFEGFHDNYVLLLFLVCLSDGRLLCRFCFWKLTHYRVFNFCPLICKTPTPQPYFMKTSFCYFQDSSLPKLYWQSLYLPENFLKLNKNRRLSIQLLQVHIETFYNRSKASHQKNV